MPAAPAGTAASGEHTHWKSKQYLQKLPACVFFDAVGAASVFGGEIADVVYAPLYAYLVYLMFQSKRLAFVGFLKELLLFTDVIPYMTILWLLETWLPDHYLVRCCGITHPRSHPYEGDARGPDLSAVEPFLKTAAAAK
ncbi:unnamed protein product [Prorocentrum cordatum]|uniref:Uncharacterized protein n=1 Tax=Prorocentrum cordatum TaxID=2364126 RepID=A0ABN9TGZ0_9DINO|nr:unnamed protein product [Polarella glacialis]|mmetsp:Transcript_110190/g.290830  ORF Transcript_110190/g.290830 Transcript_110190/m.290830 type:complete len:139 (-) Transcript_110190:75-491(-)